MPSNAESTDRPCHNCDSEYIYLSGELYCPDCGFTPHGSFEGTWYISSWEMWDRGQKQARKQGRRPYAVGGHPVAYQGDGEYEYNFKTGEFQF